MAMLEQSKLKPGQDQSSELKSTEELRKAILRKKGTGEELTPEEEIYLEVLKEEERQDDQPRFGH